MSRAVFLERFSYRRRRARDASRMLPVLGAFLFFVPGLWAIGAEGGKVSSSSTLMFLFVAWCFVIVISGVLSRLLNAPVVGDPDDDQDTSGQ